MLEELLRELLNAKNAKEKERAYVNLERVGIDRMTADMLVRELEAEDEATEKEG